MLPDTPRERLVEIYRTMLMMRRFEETLIQLTKSGTRVGHFHVYIGQECTGAAALSLLEPGDTAFTTHRNHGHLLARGADPGRILAEILGKATGYNRGKGGTLHVAVSKLGFLSTSAIVGGILPLATGAAFAAKLRGTDGISACLFGDGVLEEGVFYEAMNLAALWSLPVIYVCENNSLGAQGLSAGEYPIFTVAAHQLVDLAAPFRVPAVAVDGADAGAVHQAMQQAIQRARRGQGPSFIEARTVRWPGSKLLWPDLLTGETDLARGWDSSRIPEQHSEWHRIQDGLLRFTREMLQVGHITPDGILKLDREVEIQMKQAVQFAMDSPYPKSEAALEDVFA